MNKEIAKVEKQIQEVETQSLELTTQLKQQLTELRKQAGKKQGERDEKAHELQEVRATNEKQSKELNENLAVETAALEKETNERWVMAIEDIRSLYLTYDIEKELHDAIVGKNEAEIATQLRKGKYAAASIQAKGGKVGLCLLLILLIPHPYFSFL